MSTLFLYLDCDKTSTLPLKQNVDIFSHITYHSWRSFGLFGKGGQNVTIVPFHAPPTHGMELCWLWLTLSSRWHVTKRTCLGNVPKWTSRHWMGRPKLDKKEWTKCHTVTNCPFCEVEEQSVHFGSECQSRKISQGHNVTVVNCHRGQKIWGCFVQFGMSRSQFVDGRNIKAPWCFFCVLDNKSGQFFPVFVILYKISY